jgi:hypothetical protein
MVKRTGGTTVAEARRSPDDIAAAVAEEQQRQRRESIQADVEAWRKLVYSVADGAEPTGEQLRFSCLEVTQAGRRLDQLPVKRSVPLHRRDALGD